MSFKDFVSYNIFVDLDGVLVDFDNGFMKLTNQHPDLYEREHGEKQFWKRVEAEGKEYWANLDWMKDGKDLWKYVKKHSPSILSSPSMDPDSVRGKKMWLNKHLQGVHAIIDRNKAQYVKNGKQDILIDDTPKQIKRWEDAGGTGILHVNAKDTIKQLKKLGV